MLAEQGLFTGQLAGTTREELVEDIVADLRLLRERGLTRVRHTDLPTLRLAAAFMEFPLPDEAEPAPIFRA